MSPMCTISIRKVQEELHSSVWKDAVKFVCKLTEKIQEIGDNSLHHQILVVKFHFHATFASQVQHFGSLIATSEEVKALHHKELDDQALHYCKGHAHALHSSEH